MPLDPEQLSKIDAYIAREHLDKPEFDTDSMVRGIVNRFREKGVKTFTAADVIGCLKELGHPDDKGLYVTVGAILGRRLKLPARSGLRGANVYQTPTRAV